MGTAILKIMKILFICRQNVGRSQAAMELYRQKGGEADSAGTTVDTPETTLAERPGAINIVQVIKEDYGVDMNSNVRKQLTASMAEAYDQLIVMAESETWPEWLRDDTRAVYWNIEDPKGQDIDTTRRIVKEIEAKINSEFSF